jgi:hypothetical protein
MLERCLAPLWRWGQGNVRRRLSPVAARTPAGPSASQCDPGSSTRATSAVTTGRESAPGPRRRLGAVGGLALTVVNHGPALTGLDSEGLGGAGAGGGHRSHRSSLSLTRITRQGQVVSDVDPCGRWLILSLHERQGITDRACRSVPRTPRSRYVFDLAGQWAL